MPIDHGRGAMVKLAIAAILIGAAIGALVLMGWIIGG